MKKNKLDNLQPYQPRGKKALAPQPLCVKLPVQLDQAVRSLPDTSTWLRRVIEEAARAEKIYHGEHED